MTVYGVDAYSEIDLLADPNSVINQVLRIVSQFMVRPNRTTAGDSDILWDRLSWSFSVNRISHLVDRDSLYLHRFLREQVHL